MQVHPELVSERYTTTRIPAHIIHKSEDWNCQCQISLFVSAGLIYKSRLKVLLTSLVWEKNTIQAMAYKGLFACLNSGGIWMVWKNAGGIYERKTLFQIKNKRIKPGLKTHEHDLKSGTLNMSCSVQAQGTHAAPAVLRKFYSIIVQFDRSARHAGRSPVATE